jgi:spore maturation protein SpmB
MAERKGARARRLLDLACCPTGDYHPALQERKAAGSMTDPDETRNAERTADAPSLGPPTGASAPARLAWCARTGIRAGMRTAGWLLIIMVPVSLGVKLLAFSGVLAWIASILNPAFAWVGLPGETMIAFLTGILLNIYSAIAALGSITLTERQATIFAVMALTSHNFPVEVAVQHRTGTPAWRTIGLRLSSSLAAGVVLNWLLPPGDAPARLQAVSTAAGGLTEALRRWAIDTGWLAGKVIAIVMGLMILQRVLKEFGVIAGLSRVLFPVLWLLGLPRRTAFLWIVANVLGLAYGSAVILEESRSGALDPEDAQLLNRSMAVCHSLLEDTLLFVAVGAWAAWITLPRLALAAAVVWGYRAARTWCARAGQVRS